MNDTTIIQVDAHIEHPMEQFLDIDPNTTIVPRKERTTTLTTSALYDDKDAEIETQMQEVYDAAMDAFDMQMDGVETVEGKFKARNSEVAVQFLNAALSAAKEKSTIKQHKDNLTVAQNKRSGPSTVNNNVIVADRNELMKTLAAHNVIQQ